jgi:hypothetical protein
VTAKQPEPGKKEEDEFSVFSHMDRFDGHVPSKVLHKGDIDMEQNAVCSENAL